MFNCAQCKPENLFSFKSFRLKLNIHVTLVKSYLPFLTCRFKEHVQNNNPKHFLSEEEFVQLRIELSKASLAAMVGSDGDTPAAEEELPPGTEDLADPAKVKSNYLRGDKFTKLLLAGVSRSLPVFHTEMEKKKRKICSGLKRCLYVSSQANECQGGFKLASSQGLVLKLKGSPEAHWPPAPAPRGWYAGCIHTSPLCRLLVSGKLMVM